MIPSHMLVWVVDAGAKTTHTEVIPVELFDPAKHKPFFERTETDFCDECGHAEWACICGDGDE